MIRHIVEARRADGLVLARTAEADERVAYLVERGFPFVSHGRVAEPAPGHRWLDTDGAAAFAEAFELLYELGHRHFGLVTIDEPMNFRRLRTEGLEAAIAGRGDPAVRLDTASAPRFDRASRAAAIRSMLTAAPRPTAVLGLFDGQALAVLEEAAQPRPRGAARPLGRRLRRRARPPRSPRPGLTTFDADIHGSAVEIAGMLVRAIADPDGPAETRLVRSPARCCAAATGRRPDGFTMRPEPGRRP